MMSFLHNLLTQMDVSVWEKLARTVAVYMGILLLIRVAGKRLMAQMDSFDLVVVLLLSNVVQNAIIGPDNSLLGGLLGAVVLVAFNSIVDRFSQCSPRLRWLLEGGNTPVIEEGHINKRIARLLGLTEDEIKLLVRRGGAQHMREVTLAVLQPGGAIRVDLQPGSQGVTRDELAAAVAEIKAYIDADRVASQASETRQQS